MDEDRQAGTREQQDLLDRIFERAGELFFQFGFRRVTMDDIARAMGMSKKTIYQLIPSKDGLIERFVQTMMESKIGEVEGLFDESDDIVDATSKLLPFMQHRMAFISPTMIGDLQRYYPHLWDRINRRRMAMLDRYLYKIELAQEQGLIRPEVNARVMVRMVQVIVSEVATPKTIVELDVTLSDVMSTFLNVMLQGALSDEGRARYEEVNP